MAARKSRSEAQAVPPFEGFAPEGVDWFRALAMNQTREWFQANRAAYELLWVAPMRSLVAELQAPLAALYRGHSLRAGKVFRLHRDVRFSNDKTPYKTSASAVFGLEGNGGPLGGPAALYLQLGLEEYVGAGAYSLFPESLKLLRARVMAEKTGAPLQKLISAAHKQGLAVASMEQLKRAPAGVPVDHPRIELLKLKGLALGLESIPKKVRFSKALKPWVLEQAKATAPVVRWLLAQKVFTVPSAAPL